VVPDEGVARGLPPPLTEKRDLTVALPWQWLCTIAGEAAKAGRFSDVERKAVVSTSVNRESYAPGTGTQIDRIGGIAPGSSVLAQGSMLACCSEMPPIRSRGSLYTLVACYVLCCLHLVFSDEAMIRS